MDPFASPAELATYLQTATQAEADAGSGDTLDTVVALQALASASGAIRSVCGWSITQETVTASVSMSSRGILFLPTLRLTAVAMSVGGVPLVDGTDFAWETNGLLRAGYGAYWSSYWSATVVYTHGFTTAPDQVKAVCLERAAQTYVNPTQLVSATVGGVSDVYGRGGAVDLEPDPRLAPFKLPAVG